MLKIEFERKADSSGRGWYGGWIIVSPDEAWVLRSYEYEAKDRTFVRGTIEYDGVQDGFPTPKRVVHTAGTYGKETPSQVVTFDFDEIGFTEPPDSDFRLAAFGLPEIGRSSRSLAGTSAPWLLALSVLAAAIAIGLKTASSRFQERAMSKT